MDRYGFGHRWAYWDAPRNAYHGLSRDRVEALYAEADGIINLCGATKLREEHLLCPVRIMIDTDPVYEQIKYAKGDYRPAPTLMLILTFFTYGENLGTPRLPGAGVRHSLASDPAADRSQALA